MWFNCADSLDRTNDSLRLASLWHSMHAISPAISSRSALPLPAWFLVHEESTVLLFASEKTVQGCPNLHKVLVSNGAGVALGPDGVEIVFSKDSKAPNLFKLPSSIIMLVVDSSGVIPSISKLTPGQATYHFWLAIKMEILCLHTSQVQFLLIPW